MDLDAILKQAQKLQEDMEDIQNKIKKAEAKVSSGGGAVTASITGATEFKSIKISEELLKEPKEVIEQTLLIACNEAVQRAQEIHQEYMKKITEQLELPNVDELKNLAAGAAGDAGPRRRTDTTPPGFIKP